MKTNGVRGLLFFLLASASLAPAQTTARLNGTVVDASGASVPAATVEVFLPGGSRAVLSATTSTDGLFAFAAVPAGSYDLIITAAGFRKHTERGVTLTAGTELSIPAIRLEVGSTTEQIEVTANQLNVQTGNAEVAATITREQIRDLPTLNRSPQAFVLSQAGIASTRGNITVDGQRTSFTNVTLDGINIQDNFIRSNAVDFSPNMLLIDQVAEFTVATSNANPSAGSGASQVIMITPSGTNSFHGSALWSNRNNYFASNTWFNNAAGVGKPFLNQNQFGGTFGGYIRKDRLFFYANYEGLRNHAQSAQRRTLLTTDARQGIFTYLNGATLTKVNILQAAGVPADPTVQALIGRIPGPDKINDFTQGDSTAALLRNTGGYLFNQRNNRIRNNYTGKIDYNLSRKSTITGTFTYNTDLIDRPDVQTVGYQLAPPVVNDDDPKFLSLGWRYNPTPTLTNEVRYGFNYSPVPFTSVEDFGTALYGGLVFSNPVATFRSQGRNTNTTNFADNAAWFHGKHNLQFGVQFQRIYAEPFNDGGITPTYTLGVSTAATIGLTNAQLPGASSNDITAANNLLANLAGLITSNTQTYNVKDRTAGFVSGQTNLRQWRLDNYSVYVQDNWKIRPHLTLNLGVRWENYVPMSELKGLALLPEIVNNNHISTLLSNATLNFASTGSGRPLYNSDRNNFGPNVGLAWDITGDGKTALRIGYAMNFVNDENVASLTGIVGTNAGLSQTVTNQGLASFIRNGLPAIATPAFKVPRTFLDNYNLSRTTNFAMPDPNLRAPYVQTWNIGIQREIKQVIVDVRYVGNHGVKLFRGIDYNQIDINAGGFLGDFQRAQQNGFLKFARTGVFDPAYDATVPGSQPLTVFPQMPSGGTLTNATNRTYLQQGAVADMAFNYQSTGANGPINFMPNPYAASLRSLTNFSSSSYNSLQLEARTRSRHGLTIQGSYVYSKVLSDASSGADNNNQGRVEPLMDNRNPKLERSRALFDLTHVAKFNFVYQLPFGGSHQLNYKPLDRVLSGWLISGVFNRQSGLPFSVFSGRGTFNRNGAFGSNDGNTMNTNLTMDQLRDVMKFRMSGNGPYMVAASALGPDGRAVAADGVAPFAGQAFFMPAAGTIGQLQKRIFDGPWDTTFDFSIQKITKITEKQSIQIRAIASNLLNHPAFSIDTQTATSTTFGKISTGPSTRRILQFFLEYRF